MSLTGIWTNELRSVVLIKQKADFSIEGTYHSLVGRDPNPRPLAGRTCPVDGAKQMVAWAVCFQIEKPSEGYGSYSVCAWSGWAVQDEIGAELIKTHWLLTINVFDQRQDWSSTNVGEDTFLKISDHPDEALLKNPQALKELHEKAKSRR